MISSPEIFTDEVIVLLAVRVLPDLQPAHLAPAPDGEAGGVGGGDGGVHVPRVEVCPAPPNGPGRDPSLGPLPPPLAPTVDLGPQPERDPVICSTEDNYRQTSGTEDRLTPIVEVLRQGPLLIDSVHLGQVGPLEQAVLASLLPAEGSGDKHCQEEVN